MAKQAMRGSELIISKTGTLYHINIARRDGFPPRFLLVGDPQRVKRVAKFFDDGVKGKRVNREFVSVWGNYKGVPVAAMGTGIGTDNTEIAVTELHAVHEFDHEKGRWRRSREPLTLIRVGTSGSSQRDLVLGTVAITEHAIGLDNTGLYYLHNPLDQYRDLNEVFYTPRNEVARRVWRELCGALPPVALQVVKPYVSTATGKVVQALVKAAESLKESDPLLRFETGITTSAPGFFGPQGRRVGRLENLLIPDLQGRLALLKVMRHLALDDSTRSANNEMESSVLLRMAGEILGYQAGAICAVIANRAEGQFITPKEYRRSVDAAIKIGLEALHALA